MKVGPRGLFGRLTIGLLLAAVAAILFAAAFLYFRFQAYETQFREGTLRSFARAIAADVVASGERSFSAGRRTQTLIDRANGLYVVLDAEGQWLGGNSPNRDAFVPLDGKEGFFFELPAGPAQTTRYGLATAIVGTDRPLFVEVVFPGGEIVFDSVLEEFTKDIAWLWLPFLVLMLVTNLGVAHIALRPVRTAVAQAEAIATQATIVTIDETGLPDDVRALVRAVNLAFARLRAGYRALEEFVADVAHDLRTPIAVLKLQLADRGDDERSLLDPEINRMERMIEQLLDRARLGRIQLSPDDHVDLGEVCRRVAELMAPLVVTSGRSIELIGAERPLPVSGLFDELFRAMRNLVENALSHAPAGSEISVAIDRDSCSVSVIDDGPGFSASILSRDLSSRAPLRSDRLGGVGLGLSIAARTLRAFGGQLVLENAPRRGAKATMMLKPWAPLDRSS
ncbi:sensor histidine kinase [Pleomorphomonas sp. PLEO]|uniref:sensor histidine kinase n=1 Tax=Pleomorphomonas sp. PLEO TaxID=3239306 RepID=UPI00351DF984